jgi:hypothetical protein
MNENSGTESTSRSASKNSIAMYFGALNDMRVVARGAHNTGRFNVAQAALPIASSASRILSVQAGRNRTPVVNRPHGVLPNAPCTPSINVQKCTKQPCNTHLHM